jgi:hypothetical protein
MTKQRSVGETFAEQIRSRFELEEGKEVLLGQAALTLDYCVRLQAELDAGELLMPTRAGVRANPAGVELRQQRLVLAGSSPR